MIATKTADILQVSQYVRNNILNTQQHIQYQYTLFIIYKMKVKSRTDEFIHVFSHIVVHTMCMSVVLLILFNNL